MNHCHFLSVNAKFSSLPMTEFEIYTLELKNAFKTIKNFALSPRRQERSAAHLDVTTFSVNAKF